MPKKSRPSIKKLKKLVPADAGVEEEVPPVKAYATWKRFEKEGLPPGLRKMEKRP